MAFFNDNLKILRIKKGFSQAKDFADFVNIPYQTYIHYEKDNEPKLTNLIKIADGLGVSVDELIRETKTENDTLSNNPFIKNIVKNTDITFYEGFPTKGNIVFSHFKNTAKNKVVIEYLFKDIKNFNNTLNNYLRSTFTKILVNDIKDFLLTNCDEVRIFDPTTKTKKTNKK